MDFGVDGSYHDCDADEDRQAQNDVVCVQFHLVDDDVGVVGMAVVVASAVEAFDVGVVFPRFCDCKPTE